MDRTSLVFCTGSLVVCLVIAAIAYPFAALTPDELAASSRIVPAEEMADVDLGDFGVTSVIDLVGNYIENPPVKETGAAPAARVRFQGC